MFNIYIKDFNKNGQVIGTETLIQTVPADSVDKLRFISPIVKCEMGKVEGFDFSIEPGTPFYDAFLQMKTFIRVTYDGETIFYGRVLTIDNSGFRGTRKVRCEGPLSFLMDSPVEGVEETKRKTVTTLQYIQQLIANHNSYINNEANKCFAVGNVPGNYSGVNSEQQIKNDSRTFGSDSWTDTKSALEDLRSHYGGFLRTRAGAIGSPIYLDWMNHYFNPNTVTQKIEVGKNVLDISNITEIDNVFTAIIPIGRQNVAKSDTGNSSSRQDNLYIDGKVLRVPDIVPYFDAKGVSLDSGYHTRADYLNAVNKYGTIIKTVSLTDSTTKEKLYDDACEWIRNNYQGEVTKFTIKALDMHMIEGITGQPISKIMVGDRVTIIYPVGKEDGTFEKRTTVQTCLSITYDLYHPENTSYTFGIPANILTKTYGIRKKTGSVNSASTQKNTVGGYAPPRDKDWLDVAGGWLMRHLQYYNPPSKNPGGIYYPYPMDDKYAGYMYGSALYDPSAKTLVYAEPGTPVDGKKTWHSSIRSFTNFDYETIEKYHVCEYILYEYGIDIRTMLEVAYPGMTVDSQGNMTFWSKAFNTVTGQWEKVKSMFMQLGEALTDHALDVYSPDGEQVHSYMDTDGDWHYYYIDPKTHERVDTKIRDLTITAVQDDNFIGSMVSEGYGYRDAEGEAHIYRFGQAIENWYDGEVVIAHVDGDVIRVGSENTQWSSSVAQKVNGVFLGSTEYIVDPTTGEKSAILIGQAGQASYRARYVDDPNSPYYGQYVQDPNGNVILTGDGFWDEKNLAIKGGVYTTQDPNTKKYTSYVKSSQLVIGDRNTSTTVLQALRDSNVITGSGDTPQSLVASAIYAEDINGINAHFTNIETYYLKTANLKTAILSAGQVGMTALSVSGSGSNEGTIYASRSVKSPHYWYMETGLGLEDGVNDIKIVPPSGNSNTYTLQKFKLTTLAWEDVGTFSRATTLSGAWSSGTYTVRATPQGNINSTTIQYIAPDQDTPITSSGTIITRTFKIMYGPDEDHLYETGFSSPISINATGQGTVSGSWSNGTFTAKASLQNKTTSTTIRYLSPSGNISSSGTIVSRTFKVQYGPDDDHLYDTGYEASISINATGQGTVSGSWSNGTFTAKASLQNKTTSTTIRSLSPTGDIAVSDKVVSRTYKVRYGPDDDHLYDTGYQATVSIDASDVFEAGKAAATITLSAPEVSTIASNITSGITVKSKASNGSTGTAKTLSMSLDTYRPQGVSGTNECVVAKDGNNIVGRYDIQSICNTYKRNGESEGWSDGYEEGYNAGAEWGAEQERKKYSHKYTGTLYVNGTISAGKGSWYIKS